LFDPNLAFTKMYVRVKKWSRSLILLKIKNPIKLSRGFLNYQMK
jgi:hypothetical protein